MNDFKNMPVLSQKAKDYMKIGFKPYLFFETIKKGVRKYTCTECGRTFTTGEIKRTISNQEIALWHAKHNSRELCPYCKAKATVKNIKLKNPIHFYEDKFVCFMLANNPNDVWIRCFSYEKTYKNKLCGELNFKEWMRYHLTPGSADCWFVCSSNDWYKQSGPREAFLWNHGCYTEKYDYECLSDGIEIDETFLKYNAWEYYRYHGHNLPYIKYLCWYAIHPQIEMLAKLGHYKTIDEMVLKNSDIKTILDWSAKTPWELHRLQRDLYNHWKENEYGDMTALKLFQAIGGSKVSDFNTADKILKFISKYKSYGYENLGKAKRFIALTKKLNTTPQAVMKYCEKVSSDSGYPCPHSYGMSIYEVFNTWQDYISMAKKVAGIKAVSPFPANLKKAHDSFLKAAKLIESENDVKKLMISAKKEAAELRKRFAKIEKIYAKIKDKYSYENDKYVIVVPEKLEDLVLNNMALGLCMDRHDRYYERISTQESYIFFLRYKDKPNIPWYTLEAEPSGTLRQKRTKGDLQLSDLKNAMPFLIEWQKEVSKRLNKSDRRLAEKAKVLRNEHFAELEQSGKKIGYGKLAGQKLIDVLKQDLMEIEETA